MPQDTGSATATPEIVIDRTGTPDRRIMIVDSFGQRVQMSIDQFRNLAAEGVSERFLKSRACEHSASARPAVSRRGCQVDQVRLLLDQMGGIWEITSRVNVPEPLSTELNKSV